MRYSSGYQKLYDDDGWALLIGVDITRMSSMHLAEEGIALSHDVTTILPETLQIRYPSSQWYVQYRTPGAPVLIDTWLEIQAQADAQGWIHHGLIGRAPSMLVRIRPVIDMYRQWLLDKYVS
jgi:aminoglycoside N3'-acetyltransferase